MVGARGHVRGSGTLEDMLDIRVIDFNIWFLLLFVCPDFAPSYSDIFHTQATTIYYYVLRLVDLKKLTKSTRYYILRIYPPEARWGK